MPNKFLLISGSVFEFVCAWAMKMRRCINYGHMSLTFYQKHLGGAQQKMIIAAFYGCLLDILRAGFLVTHFARK